MMVKSLADMAALAEDKGLKLSDLAALEEARESGLPTEQVRRRMAQMLAAMRDAAQQGADRPWRSVSGLTGGEANRYYQYTRSGGLLGEPVSTAIAYALASSCVNASMGRIVAAPTAGACGILPGVLLALQQWRGYDDEQVISALLCAGLVGQVIAARATLSGAQGGCQAECGSASAMAAAAACELSGADVQTCCHAAALALKNALGLVCDPVAGLVEVPCVKRNGVYAALALSAADLALAGICSAIPVDEVIDAMYAIGQTMPATLRETAMGGLACTPTGCRLRERVLAGQE